MLVKLAFVMQRLKKYLKNFFVMINKDGGGTAVMRGDIELMGGPPLGKTLRFQLPLRILVGGPSDNRSYTVFSKILLKPDS